ncbi:hypothetical protein BC827DRAFT_332411 [Russula dissimulans]|nr:hypothetical protein BC827DRAFT_332411 [Russula dissimulans]
MKVRGNAEESTRTRRAIISAASACMGIGASPLPKEAIFRNRKGRAICDLGTLLILYLCHKFFFSFSSFFIAFSSRTVQRYHSSDREKCGATTEDQYCDYDDATLLLATSHTTPSQVHRDHGTSILLVLVLIPPPPRPSPSRPKSRSPRSRSRRAAARSRHDRHRPERSRKRSLAQGGTLYYCTPSRSALLLNNLNVHVRLERRRARTRHTLVLSCLGTVRAAADRHSLHAEKNRR